MRDRAQLAQRLEADLLIKGLTTICANLGDITVSFLTKIPFNVFSTLDSFKNSASSFRDYSLMKNVMSFIEAGAEWPDENREQLVERFNADDVYGQTFGMFTMSALDRLDYPQKAKLLTKIFLAYSEGTIDKLKLIRFKNIIETFELEDLELLDVRDGKYLGYPDNTNNPALYKFQNAGLILVEFPATSSDKGFLILDGNGSEEDDNTSRSTATAKLTNHGKLFMNCLSR